MANGTIEAPIAVKTITPTYPSGVTNVAGAIFKYGHLVAVSKCVKITADIARNSTLFSLPEISSQWNYLVVMQGNIVTPAHINGSDIIMDADLLLSNGAYPITIGTGVIL